MDPLFLYIALFVMAIAFFSFASVMTKKPSRACLSCGQDTPIEGRSCRHCGYRQSRV